MTRASQLLAAALLGAAFSPTTASGQSAADPRVEWTQLRRAGQLEEAVAAVREYLPGAPESESAGAFYAMGILLLDLDRPGPAADVFALALGRDATLEPYVRYRLAQAEAARGHPEVAAGLLAGLLSSRPPEKLTAHAARLLAGTLEESGDCRLLSSLDGWSLSPASRRLLRLRRSDCARPDDPAAADRELLELLRDDTGDGVALEAAERLDGRLAEGDGQTALDVAMAYFGQRRFDKAVDYFASALAPSTSLTAAQRNDFDTHYALARSYFWLGDYRRAAASFGDLATLTRRPGERARALYQRGRSLELTGDTAAAGAAFREALDAEPDGGWAAASLTSMMRLDWMAGDESAALAHYARLGSRRGWRGSRARAALFLAASDLVRDRADRARAWLDDAAGASGVHLPELAYWQGRLAESDGDPARAVERYRVALLDDPVDPWAREGARRLADPSLAPSAARAATRLAASSRERDRLGAWILAPASEHGEAALEALRATLAGRSREREFMRLAAAPTELWPFWRGNPRSAEERLLALGDWELGIDAAVSHFPIGEPELAMARARVLAEHGQTRRSILTAEVLGRQAPSTVPSTLWPEELLRLLYPMAHGALLRAEASDAGLDPRFIAALIREESRFDADAVSAAAARGLTQFVLPTARRLGTMLGLGTLDADSLHRPEIAVRLGAAYLAELGARFGDRQHLMLAAYNAGEPQAELWRGYCFSDEPAELLTKVGFRETRNYLRKVLRSYGRYRDLYPEP